MTIVPNGCPTRRYRPQYCRDGRLFLTGLGRGQRWWLIFGDPPFRHHLRTSLTIVNLFKVWIPNRFDRRFCHPDSSVKVCRRVALTKSLRFGELTRNAVKVFFRGLTRKCLCANSFSIKEDKQIHLDDWRRPLKRVLANQKRRPVKWRRPKGALSKWPSFDLASMKDLP